MEGERVSDEGIKSRRKARAKREGKQGKVKRTRSRMNEKRRQQTRKGATGNG